MKTKHFALLLLLSIFSPTGCRLNEGYSIKKGEKFTGNMSTVNGHIHIGDNAEVSGYSRTVNGCIDVGLYSIVRHLESVNGNVQVGKEAVVSGGIKLVNGELNCESGVKVKGNIETVNGKIVLMGSFVEDDLVTYNGDIKLDNTIIRGNIKVKKRSGITGNRLYIDITDDSIVEGDIINEEKDMDVTVCLSRGGKVNGRINGVKVVKR